MREVEEGSSAQSGFGEVAVHLLYGLQSLSYEKSEG